jgi:hypothetical protein
MKFIPSTSKPSDGNVFARSSGIGGSCDSSTDCRQILAKDSFDVFSVIFEILYPSAPVNIKSELQSADID